MSVWQIDFSRFLDTGRFLDREW